MFITPPRHRYLLAIHSDLLHHCSRCRITIGIVHIARYVSSHYFILQILIAVNFLSLSPWLIAKSKGYNIIIYPAFLFFVEFDCVTLRAPTSVLSVMIWKFRNDLQFIILYHFSVQSDGHTISLMFPKQTLCKLFIMDLNTNVSMNENTSVAGQVSFPHQNN